MDKPDATGQVRCDSHSGAESGTAVAAARVQENSGTGGLAIWATIEFWNGTTVAAAQRWDVINATELHTKQRDSAEFCAWFTVIL